MSFNTTLLADVDPLLWEFMTREMLRQERHIELIASENYVSPQVLQAQGSVLTNKYAEGYPGKRYYGGCEYVDEVERLAITRAKELFGADYVNVQPHSGSSANAAALMAMMQAGETLLGMNLSQGGHLTHGCPVNFSGKLYQSVQYGLNPKTGEIDYDQVQALAEHHRPKVIIAGFSAYSGILDWHRFRQIADSVGAYLMADIAHVAGLVVTGLYPSPVQIADVTTTTTHKTLRGPRAGLILAKANAELEKKLSSAVFPGLQGGPLLHIIAAKAVAFQEALQPSFKEYQRQVLANANTLANFLKDQEFSIVSGGTHNHMFLVSLLDKQITGQAAEAALGRAGIVVNKNSVPNDPNSPFVTGGLRLGSPAVTTRGFKEPEMVKIGEWITEILSDLANEEAIARIHREVQQLCLEFPVY